MIDFALSDEERMMQSAAADFASKALRPRLREHEKAGVDAAARAGFERAGLHLLGLPENEGGVTAGRLAQCLVIEELAFGDAVAAFALLQPAWNRSALLALGITGSVDFVFPVQSAAPAQIAWLPLAWAGKGAFFNEVGGVSIHAVTSEPVRALALHAAGGVRVMVGALAGSKSVSREIVQTIRAEQRLRIAALLIGLARSSLSYLQEYLQERKTFGKALAQHQGVAFIYAEMAMRADAARLLLHRAALQFAPDAPHVAADAYLECAEAALHVTNYGVQLMGGHGYMKDHPVEKWMREARALTLLWGGQDAALDDAAPGLEDMAWS